MRVKGEAFDRKSVRHPYGIQQFGDAENDHAFLAACGRGVAVANKLKTLKERADIVTRAGHGEGVKEIAEQLRKSDLAAYDSRLGWQRQAW